ncbi:MAG: cytochrome d ubiquinol oxidase subunit [Pseudomonadota bacterium]|jgi:cytochrome d ubiquinol oxidase subunit II
MIFDYDTLRFIWWAFLGVLLIGFAISGGYDCGVAILLPYLGKTDQQRRVILNTIGSTWEGNQVWLITAGGALFAAWPMAYAVAFSSFYLALFLTLLALWLRPLGFDYRSKLTNPNWRSYWDSALFIGGLVPALIFGVAFGNLLRGIPFHLENDMQIRYLGDFFGLLNPFALLAGIVSLFMLVMHAGIFLQIKTEGEIQQRAKSAVIIAGSVFLSAFLLAGLWITRLEGYHINTPILSNAVSNPLTKLVKRGEGLWLDNYEHFPILWSIPISVFITALLAMWLSKRNYSGWAFISSAIALAGVILTAGVSMFPFLIPSNISLHSSLTIWDASSSQRTLHIMFWVTIFFLPIILLYTRWVFRVLRGKMTEEMIEQHSHQLY